jgi:cold shock CspA family protein
MPMGKVKWFNSQNGSLNEGQRISFDLARDRGKTSAVNLKLA